MYCTDISLKLRAIDHRSVSALRLVCRRFDSIAVPVFYNAIELNDAILDPNAEHLYPGALQHIYQHTNHVVVRGDLDSQRVKRVLCRVQRLLSVRYVFVACAEACGFNK